MEKKLKNLRHVEQQLLALQHSSNVEDERSKVLQMVAQGDDLSVILNRLCFSAKRYNPAMFCSILRLDRDNNTLHPIASHALPKTYCDALDGVVIGSSVGSCGTAAFTRKRIIVENINTHPYWSQYKSLALNAGLQSCWSEPIIGKEGTIYGTFAIYYSTPKSPSNDDLHFIEVSANLAAIVFENKETNAQLIQANAQLAQTVNQRNKQLEQANRELQSALEKQNKLHIQRINSEKVLTTNALISGFAHDISLPVSVALTAIGAAEAKLNDLTTYIDSGKATKSTLRKLTDEINQAIEMNQNKLLQATSFLSKFNDIKIKVKNETTPYHLNTLFEEFEKVFTREDLQHTIRFESPNTLVSFSKDALWQVIYHLVDNSITHGFKNKTNGSILISSTLIDNEILINYQDDGCGINEDIQSLIFEPFFSSQKERGCTGLGLNTIANILSTNLKGEIRYINVPVGARFEISLPLSDVNSDTAH